MKKTLMIIGAILLAVLVAAVSFWGGMAYQTNRDNQVRANFLNSRGLANSGGFPNGGQILPGDGAPNGQIPGFFGGGRTTGQVKSIDGNIMMVSTAQNVTTVNLSASTRIEKSAPAAISDLQTGLQVTVTGQRDSNGDITAIQVLILNTNPSTTGTAP